MQTLFHREIIMEKRTVYYTKYFLVIIEMFLLYNHVTNANVIIVLSTLIENIVINDCFCLCLRVKTSIKRVKFTREAAKQLLEVYTVF